MNAIRIIASIVLGLAATTSAFAAEPEAAPAAAPSPVAVIGTSASAVSTITLAGFIDDGEIDPELIADSKRQLAEEQAQHQADKQEQRYARTQ